MAFRYYPNKRAAQRAARQLANETGRVPTIFQDDKLYRVQDNDIGGARMAEILGERD